MGEGESVAVCSLELNNPPFNRNNLGCGQGGLANRGECVFKQPQNCWNTHYHRRLMILVHTGMLSVASSTSMLQCIGFNNLFVTHITRRNSFISWAADFYGHNDMDLVRSLVFVQALVLTTVAVAGSVCYPNANLMTQCLIHFMIVVMVT